jgi:hypothetical protein
MGTSNSVSNELVRVSIMMVLAANNSKFGMGLDLICHLGMVYGLANVSKSAVEEELRYLIDKGLVAHVEKVVSPENAKYRITAEGRDWYAQQGYAQ